MNGNIWLNEISTHSPPCYKWKTFNQWFDCERTENCGDLTEDVSIKHSNDQLDDLVATLVRLGQFANIGQT